ncbi:MAG: acyltransferase family protein [Burkholderiales bacterium]|nr:acyltransferase family protein [Burkholderiales bacterium]
MVVLMPEKADPNASSSERPLIKPSYRADIDGLRALAVLAVIAFHAFPEWVSGGFIGVDVFFVISGFLITTLIQDSLQQQSFSFRAFYASRVRRLFPALVIVLLACQVFGWFALLANEYKALGKHIAASTAFIPNFIFWSESGYFDYAADAKPLLHLWSLGIEEQFYLFWPIVIWLGLNYRVSVFKVSIAIFLGSLALNLMMIEEAPLAAFFSPLTRMWELLSGCLLAYLVSSKPPAFEAFNAKLGSIKLIRHAISLLGLVLLLLGAILFDQDMLYPGVWALVPVLGTCFIIFTGNQSWINTSVLSNRFLVWIGLISFPLYLWHWPLLSFARIMEGSKPDWQIRAVLVAVSFVLAILTYYFIEQPIRFGRNLRFKTYVLIMAMSLLGALGLATYSQDGFKSRTTDKAIEAQLTDLKFDIPDSEGWYCQDMNHDSPRCHSTGPNPSVVVIGDSHALTIYSGLRERFKAKGQDIGLYGASDGCPPLLNVVIQDQGGDFRNCLKKGTQAVQRVIADAAIKEVILTSRGPMYTTAKGFGDVELEQFGSWVLHFDGEDKGVRSNEEVFALGLTKTLDALLAAGKKLTFLHDVPELGFDIRSCFAFRPLTITSKVVSPCAVSRKEFEARTEAYRAMVNKILLQRPEIKVIDLSAALCDEKWCWGARDDTLFYIDDDHLSHRGADYVVRKLWDKF